MKKIEIGVVEYQGELWFEFNGLKFDSIDAEWRFDRKEFFLYRSGSLLATTRIVEQRGVACFQDYGETGGTLQGIALYAEKFIAGDMLAVEVPDDFDLDHDLKLWYSMCEAISQVMPIGVPMSMKEMESVVVPAFEVSVESMHAMKVVRFRKNR